MTSDVIADIRRKHAQWLAAEWHLTAGVTTEMIQYIGTLLDCIEQANAAVDGVNLTEGHIRDNATPDQLREMLLGAGLEIERQKKEIEWLRASNSLHRAKADGEYWAWGDDEEDHLESLVCPVLIPARSLRSITNETSRLREALQPFAIQWDIIAQNAAHDSEPVAADIVMFRLCNSYAAISVRDCRKAWETLHTGPAISAPCCNRFADNMACDCRRGE